MPAQTIRRSQRILARSAAADEQALPRSRKARPAEPAKSSGLRCKRKAPATQSIAASKEVPDPQYLEPAALAKAREEYLKNGLLNPCHSLPIWGNNPYAKIWEGFKTPDPKIHTLPPMDPVAPLKELAPFVMRTTEETQIHLYLKLGTRTNFTSLSFFALALLQMEEEADISSICARGKRTSVFSTTASAQTDSCPCAMVGSSFAFLKELDG
ncbi:hypothetical protein OE88DRAFT_1738890 [Heliocybe sulcata]|uniref:Uncharacterized protein n=1 Tax=Heliocybe sulcata TaxID=5364 RepID=A0A5C3MQI0_9AGAM|nr:hypothetical protein OE88DRAFT_1738890 [Heliocybe sulcata]